MAAPGRVQIADPAEIRSRIDSIAAGVRLFLAVATAAAVYVAATWDGENRVQIALLAAATAALAGGAAFAPREAVVRSRHRELYFLAWAIGHVGLIAAMVMLDGGPRSPLALLFFLPLAFVALSYPLTSVVAIGALDVLAFVVIGAISGESDPVMLGFFATCLGFTAVICAWEAHDHDRQRDDLARVSRADPLTGCLNRRGFSERLDAELDQGFRTGRQLSLVVLDLDHFKDVNDTRGHAAGDELLRWTVQTVEETIRPMDSIGRLGGDEFAVLLPGSSRHEALEVAQRIGDAVGRRVAVSAGVSSFPSDAATLDELHQHADAELYAAKHGRKPDVTPGQRELSWAAALARAVDMRMAVPDEHSTVVAHYAGAIAQRLGWHGADLAMIRMAAMLHDVGKVSVPDQILRKPGPLSLDEYEEIKDHPVAGAAIVEQIDGLKGVVPWIRHSHEHMDGSGYPDGLRGEEIPEASRILLVADAFDAMTSHRPYGRALPAEIALEELHRNAHRQFDPRAVEALEAYLKAASEAAAGDDVAFAGGLVLPSL